MKPVPYFTQLLEYGALLFNAVTLHSTPNMRLPDLRSDNQKYILFSPGSAANYPISAKYNHLFNWTWTYKLDSDINFKYIVVMHKDGEEIGPKQDMHWIPNAKMNKTSLNIVQKIQSKTIAAAWIVSNCDISKH